MGAALNIKIFLNFFPLFLLYSSPHAKYNMDIHILLNQPPNSPSHGTISCLCPQTFEQNIHGSTTHLCIPFHVLKKLKRKGCLPSPSFP